jgi:ATP-dependent protease HslVU (ClpYQ) peptidase subunit
VTDADRVKMRRTQALIALTDAQSERFKALVDKYKEDVLAKATGEDAHDWVIDKMLDLMEAYEWHA